MAVPVWATNDVPTATDFNVWLTNTLAAVKTANESVTSSTTLQNDDELLVSVAANSNYQVDCYLRYDGATAADINIQWNVPASATFNYSISRLQTGASDATSDAEDEGSDAVSMGMGTIGSGTTASARILGHLIVAGTAGTFGLKWAQIVSNATATRVLSRSFLVLRRII